MSTAPNVQMGCKAPYYVHLPVKSANNITFSKVIVWCNENNYNLSYHSSGTVNGGWHVQFDDAANPINPTHYVSVGFESLTEKERLLLELRWAGQ